MPDSWTSVNGHTLDWSNELQLHDNWDVLAGLMKATVERCKATDQTPPDILWYGGVSLSSGVITIGAHGLQITDLLYMTWTRDGVNYRQWDVPITNIDSTTITVTTTATDGNVNVYLQNVKPVYPVLLQAKAIETKILALIEMFLNHENSSGDWSGTTDTPPYWTVTDIYLAIGMEYIDEVLTPPPIYIAEVYELGPWAKQQYQILNMLRWTKLVGLSGPDPYAEWPDVKSVSKAVYSQSTWAAAETAFNAASWADGSYLTRILYIGSVDGDYAKQIEGAYWKWSKPISHACDIYLKVTGNWEPDTFDFEGIPPCTTENDYYKISSYAADTDHEEYFPNPAAVASMTNPDAASPKYGYTCIGTGSDCVYFVFKFDFDFKDW